MGPEMRREKRYAQCRFVDMSVLKRFMLGQVCFVFYNFGKARSIGANIKALTFHWKYVIFDRRQIFGTGDGLQLP